MTRLDQSRESEIFDGLQLNNGVLMSRNYRLTLWKFDVLKTSIFALEGKYLFDQFKPIRIGENLGVTIRVDSVSPRTNTIASRDRFKPMRIG